MKIAILLLVSFVFLFSCSLYHYTSFSEVTAPYIEKYGWPDTDFSRNFERRPQTIWTWETLRYFVVFEYYDLTGWKVAFDSNY